MDATQCEGLGFIAQYRKTKQKQYKTKKHFHSFMLPTGQDPVLSGIAQPGPTSFYSLTATAPLPSSGTLGFLATMLFNYSLSLPRVLLSFHL